MPTKIIELPGSRFRLEIGYFRDTDHVTVGSTCEDWPDDGDTGASRVLEYVNGLLADADMPQIGYDELCRRLAARGMPLREFGGWHAAVNSRRRLNDLIYALKTARDSAFGRDA